MEETAVPSRRITGRAGSSDGYTTAGRVAALIAAAIFVVVLVTGCSRPRLASRPLTSEELIWSEVIRRSYPDWTPPYYFPAADESPVRMTGDAAGSDFQRTVRDTAPAAPEAVQPREDPQFVPAE